MHSLAKFVQYFVLGSAPISNMLSTRDKSVITAKDPTPFAKSCHSLPCPLLCPASPWPSDVSITQRG